MPPLKLNLVNSGISQMMGAPRIKKRATGTIIIAPMAVRNTGRILPVSSWTFLACFLNHIVNAIPAKNAIVTIMNSGSVEGLGMASPRLDR